MFVIYIQNNPNCVWMNNFSSTQYSLLYALHLYCTLFSRCQSLSLTSQEMHVAFPPSICLRSILSFRVRSQSTALLGWVLVETLRKSLLSPSLACLDARCLLSRLLRVMMLNGAASWTLVPSLRTPLRTRVNTQKHAPVRKPSNAYLSRFASARRRERVHSPRSPLGGNYFTKPPHHTVCLFLCLWPPPLLSAPSRLHTRK